MAVVRSFLALSLVLSNGLTLFAQQQSTARILLYTATADFRHDSIPTAIEALKNQSSTYNVEFDATEDKSKFSDENLANYDGIIFVSTTGESESFYLTQYHKVLRGNWNVDPARFLLVLDNSGKTAFRDYLDKGGNFIAVHSASDSLRNTTWFGDEVGAFFDYHPALQNATVDVTDASHPSTDMLPSQWHVQDEMYNFKSDPRSVGAVVILSANESSYITGLATFNQGTPHPTAWYQEHGAGVDAGGTAGRSFYTSLGHLNETWMDNLFLAHVMGGVMWSLQANTTKAFNSSGLVGSAASGSGSSSGSD
ncbi:class I glutamine amidotransferase-like protein [Phellopilus nigrolimitatus]|nr:class I glutamine amidotransferase-like protein [Phellopilus nigrolimitatus]